MLGFVDIDSHLQAVGDDLQLFAFDFRHLSHRVSAGDLHIVSRRHLPCLLHYHRLRRCLFADAFHYACRAVLKRRRRRQRYFRVFLLYSQMFAEGVELITYLLRLLFLCLRLANSPYSVLYHLVGPTQHLFCLVLCLTNNLLLLCLYAAQLRLIGCDQLFEPLLMLTYSLTFSLPVSFIACYLPKIPVKINIALSCPGNGIIENLLRQAYLLCYLKGE